MVKKSDSANNDALGEALMYVPPQKNYCFHIIGACLLAPFILLVVVIIRGVSMLCDMVKGGEK
jgi:hypothetical protein